MALAQNSQNTRSRPNFFVGLRLFDTNLHDAVRDIQSEICLRSPSLSSFMISPCSLHITLFVLCLETASEVNLAGNCLQECSYDLSDLFSHDSLAGSNNSLVFNELASFGTKVLYLKPKESNILSRISTFVERSQKSFHSAGLLPDVSTSNERPFTPHATIAKLRKSYRKRSRDIIEPRSYENLLSMAAFQNGGLSVNLRDIDLLSMQEKESDGYYKSYSQLQFPITL